MGDSKRFATWLRQQLEQRGWNPTAVSERLGVDRSTLARWLAGTSRPSADNLRLLSELLEEPLAILYETAGYPADIGALANLTPEELELLSDFRKLSPQQRKMVRAAARAGLT